MNGLLLFALVLGGGCLVTLDAAKILGIFPFPGPSQYIFAQPYFKALTSRGHEVTVISAFPQKQPIANFTDIVVDDIFKMTEDIAIDDYMVEGIWTQLTFMSAYGNFVTLNVFDNHAVQQLLQSKQHFDVIIVETFYNEALLGFAEHFGAHLIGISTFGTFPMIDDQVGNTSPVSYISNFKLGFTDRMTYAQRLNNLFINTLEFLHLQFHHLPLQHALYRKHFPSAQHDFLDVRKNFSLMLLNQHFSLSFPRPYVPNMIEVGGMHLQRKRGVLPADMQRFLDESGDAGVIYFSLGSNIKSIFLPQEKLDIIMRTFGSLKQRVMWKFEKPDLPGKPDNVFISKWFPQSDILAHPSVKLFITHGGLLSTIESIYHAKPVLGMPIFLDQLMNVERAKRAGFGLSVDYKQLTEHELKEKIEELLREPKYTKMAQLLSKRYRDQPIEPLEKAIYWTEYVLRHDGAPHMRCAAQDLNFVQYHSLDTIVVLFGGLALILLFIWMFAKLLAWIVRRRTNKSSKEKQF